MDRDMIILKVNMPIGTSLEETERVVTIVENLMKQEPGVDTISVQAGSQAEENPADLAYGISVTDACISWEETKRILKTTAKHLTSLKDAG